MEHYYEQRIQDFTRALDQITEREKLIELQEQERQPITEALRQACIISESPYLPPGPDGRSPLVAREYIKAQHDVRAEWGPVDRRWVFRIGDTGYSYDEFPA